MTNEQADTLIYIHDELCDVVRAFRLDPTARHALIVWTAAQSSEWLGAVQLLESRLSVRNAIRNKAAEFLLFW